MRQAAHTMLEARISDDYRSRMDTDDAVLDLLPSGHAARHDRAALASKRYSDLGFVGAMVERQFGFAVSGPSPDMTHATSARQHVQGGCEPYYAVMSGLLRQGTNSIAGDRPVAHVDVGTGVGRLVAESASFGVQLGLGLDLFPEPLAYAHRIVVEDRRVELPLRVTRCRQTTVAIDGLGRSSVFFGVADAHELPLNDKSFELVSCCNVLHRVSDPLGVLREVQRVTAIGGFLLLSNSYDWDHEYSEQAQWFDDTLDLIRDTQDATWSVHTTVDPVPYMSRIFDRKYTYALNEVLLLRRDR